MLAQPARASQKKGGLAMERTELFITLKRNPGWPKTDDQRRRFDKSFEEAPWSEAVEATIYLSDPAWEMLGFAQELKITIEKVK